MFHSIASFLIFIFGLCGITAVVRMLFHLVVTAPRNPALFKCLAKRAFLLPSWLFSNTLHNCGLPGWVGKVLCFVFAILVALEGYRYSGFDTSFDSYTEYPGSNTCMLVQVQRTDSKNSKFYQLPAEIRRLSDEDYSGHVITAAYWPNGGYLDFTNGEPVVVVPGRSSYGVDQEGNEWEIILTSTTASHPKVAVTVPHFTFTSFFSVFAFLILILGAFSLQCPMLVDSEKHRTIPQ